MNASVSASAFRAIARLESAGWQLIASYSWATLLTLGTAVALVYPDGATYLASPSSMGCRI